MSDSLLPRLKEMLEFDIDVTVERAAVYAKKRADMLYAGEAKKRSPFDVMRGSYRHGAKAENERLQPLLNRLVECVEALEKIEVESHNGDGTTTECEIAGLAQDALQALRDEVDKQTKGE